MEDWARETVTKDWGVLRGIAGRSYVMWEMMRHSRRVILRVGICIGENVEVEGTRRRRRIVRGEKERESVGEKSCGIG